MLKINWERIIQAAFCQWQYRNCTESNRLLNEQTVSGKANTTLNNLNA